MKKRRKLVAMAGAAVLALSLTACGSISLNLGSEKSRMEGYVQGYLDLTYLGKLNKDYQTEMELSEEEAQQQYEEGIQVEVEFFESGIGLIDYPTVSDGADGLAFVEACLESSRSGNTWVTIDR